MVRDRMTRSGVSVGGRHDELDVLACGDRGQAAVRRELARRSSHRRSADPAPRSRRRAGLPQCPRARRARGFRRRCHRRGSCRAPVICCRPPSAAPDVVMRELPRSSSVFNLLSSSVEERRRGVCLDDASLAQRPSPHASKRMYLSRRA